MTQRTFGIGYGSLLWCNVGITSAGAKAFHLHNNNIVIIILVRRSKRLILRIFIQTIDCLLICDSWSKLIFKVLHLVRPNSGFEIK